MMTTQDAPADTAPALRAASPAAPEPVPAPPSWPWRRGALLLAIAPAPLAAAATFAPARLNLLAGVAGIVVMVAGIAGGIWHIGLFFVPALVVLAVGTVKLWREQS